MDLPKKSCSVQNLLLRALLAVAVLSLLRFFYLIAAREGPAAAAGNLIIARPPADLGAKRKVAALASPPSNPLWRTREWRRAVDHYKLAFDDLIADGYLSPSSRCLSVDSPAGRDVFALREIGVSDAVGISKRPAPPLVVRGDASRHPFPPNAFDFIFADGVDRLPRPSDFAAETCRTLRPEGFLVVRTTHAKDLYSLNSFVDLFDCCRLVRSRDVAGPDSTPLREIVLKKENSFSADGTGDSSDEKKCLVQGHKRELVWHAEPLITEEPLKPWITLKKNVQNIKYLPLMADLSFKRKYVYIDVGARSYGSSIGSWFRKQYPKQNRTFEIHAIEADPAFHNEYSGKKHVNLIPYAAWVRNETISFEIRHSSDQKPDEVSQKGGQGMGRILPSDPLATAGGNARKIKVRGFDFANWLKSTVSEKDFVVIKMDVEGTEFNLIPRLIETGAICLIDELFLECHYNRWQRCCPGERSSKYSQTYGQCLDLFSSLRESGLLVHQWW